MNGDHYTASYQTFYNNVYGGSYWGYQHVIYIPFEQRSVWAGSIYSEYGSLTCSLCGAGCQYACRSVFSSFQEP